MSFRRLYIKFKIWRTEVKIRTISNDIELHRVNLVTLNIRFFENKIDINKIHSDFVKSQTERKRTLLKELESLKITLKNL